MSLVSNSPLRGKDKNFYFTNAPMLFVILSKEKLLAKHIDIEIDKLTNSIENRISGEVFDTDVVKIEPSQSKLIKKNDWGFDWKKELKESTRDVFKLSTVANPSIIQGLISLEDNKDHILMHLIENAQFNKGKKKLYVGVPANLVAYACKYSFDLGYEGYVGFIAKSKLIEHYKETLRAEVLYGSYMRIDTASARYLIDRYFNK